MTSLLRLITMRGRAWRDAVAQCSSMQRGKALPRLPDVSRLNSIRFAEFCPVLVRTPDLSLNKAWLRIDCYFARSPKIALPIRI